MGKKSNSEKAEALQQAVERGARSVVPNEMSAVVVDANTAKGVEMMTDAELVAIHEELCSGEPPFCTRTYHPRDYRAHVLLLIAEKQKRIA